MAEKLCQLKKKGGGKLTETELWTNPNPSTATSSLTCDLSSSITNFKFIRIYFKPITSSNLIYYVEITPEMMQQSVSAGANVYGLTFMIGCVGSSDSRKYARFVTYSSNTKIIVSNSYGVNAEINNSNLNIVTKICGLK